MIRFARASHDERLDLRERHVLTPPARYVPGFLTPDADQAAHDGPDHAAG